MRTAIALDVGGSAIRAARVTADGISGNVVRREIGVDVTADELIGHLQQAVGSLRPYDEGDVGVGVGFPAFLDAHGRVAWSLNLPALNGLDLPAALRPVAGGRPVFPITDLAAAAIAEARLGSGRGVERFLCVSVGTGVNAAVVVDGQLLETASGVSVTPVTYPSTRKVHRASAEGAGASRRLPPAGRLREPGGVTASQARKTSSPRQEQGMREESASRAARAKRSGERLRPGVRSCGRTASRSPEGSRRRLMSSSARHARNCCALVPRTSWVRSRSSPRRSETVPASSVRAWQR